MPKDDAYRSLMVTAGVRLPTGTVTLVFTDIEGSTRLFHELGESFLATDDIGDAQRWERQSTSPSRSATLA